MAPQSMENADALLANWQASDEATLRALIPLVYNELCRIAHHRLRGQRPGHSLLTTDLVNEVYLRLAKDDDLRVFRRSHLIALAALMMRQILIEYARKRHAAKRDGGQRVTLDSRVAVGGKQDIDLLALDDALNRLNALDARQAQIVELRFFGGLSVEETAKVTGISPATVKRHWSVARVWLHKELSRDKLK